MFSLCMSVCHVVHTLHLISLPAHLDDPGSTPLPSFLSFAGGGMVVGSRNKSLYTRSPFPYLSWRHVTSLSSMACSFLFFPSTADRDTRSRVG
ncbi:hypothetical protein F4810DRAFT_657759 [Camillea tinctor]|nr:hypothetical protein F4810DRAFT_657759 [Camillea tinctor]